MKKFEYGMFDFVVIASLVLGCFLILHKQIDNLKQPSKPTSKFVIYADSLYDLGNGTYIVKPIK